MKAALCTLLAFLLVIPASVTKAQTGDDKTAREKSPRSLLEILQENGAKLKCYFTFEYRGYGIAGRMSKANPTDLSVKTDLGADSIPALLYNLRSYLGNGFVVVQDSKESKIVHIIEKVLADDRNYVLNRRISVKYAGSLGPTVVENTEKPGATLVGGLFAAVAEKAGSIKEGSLDTHSGATGGYACDTTQINVNATNETVRNILTDYLPKANYNRILWRAVTDKIPVKDGKEWVFFEFFGPNS